MSGPLTGARERLELAATRRISAEQRIERAWQDAARRLVEQRILIPLERETGQVRTALDQLDAELTQALTVLAN
jgi:hypothetical protein